MGENVIDFKREHSIVSSSIAQPSSDVVNRKKARSIRCVSIFKLTLAALPTLVFGVFTIAFSLQQDAAAKAAREQDQRQPDVTNRRILFKEYMDDMKGLLLDENFEQNISKSLLQIRVQTLTVLMNLDPARKRDVFLFLYESRLIRHDHTPNIDIRGADFSEMKLIQTSTQSCEFPFLHLPGVYLENTLFDGCTLIDASDLIHANFQNTNLTKSQFHDDQLYQAKFTGALLIQSIVHGGVVQNVDLTNADLYQCVIGNELFNPITYIGFKPNILMNTRLPNGSFININSQNLILSDRAETECHLNLTSHWREVNSNDPIKIIHFQANVPVNMSKVGDDCFFIIDKDLTSYQHISVQNFSHMIDLKLAMFNLSAWFGLQNPNDMDSLLVGVHFSQNKNSYDVASSIFNERTIKLNALTLFNYLARLIILVSLLSRSFIILYRSKIINIYLGTNLLKDYILILYDCLDLIKKLLNCINGITETFIQSMMSIQQLNNYKNILLFL
ncbi:unnamed protein product [Rotaria magnacalcarata]|uniref:Pentapeptide repeat-containing protein n=1 Tax=Rotaria magnacalcarata TaxID=392030 RepID=A0A819RSQ2_9BILA|nr:unnamed protein product [Rotaria magnacalcarata]